MSRNTTDEHGSFSEKIVHILNQGALNLAMAIGYRSQLFEAMDTFDSPHPLSALAERSGLNARYVREWLGVMVCGGIVELSRDPGGEDLFYLPRAHADVITRRAGSANLGVYTQEIPLLISCAFDAVAEGLRTGQGVPYAHYPMFQHFMAELADAKHRRVLVDVFLPSVDSGKLVEKMRRGIRVCDLGCAEGVALILMAEAFPRSRFVGIDISEVEIQKARARAEEKGLQNVVFLTQDAADLQKNRRLRVSFDYVTAFDAIHDQTQPLNALKGVYAILKAGGIFSMVDIAASSHLSENKHHPMGAFLYAVSLMHCVPVGLVDGGKGLGMMWGRQKAVEMLREAGFTQVKVLHIPDDAFNLHFFCRK